MTFEATLWCLASRSPQKTWLSRLDSTRDSRGGAQLAEGRRRGLQVLGTLQEVPAALLGAGPRKLNQGSLNVPPLGITGGGGMGVIRSLGLFFNSPLLYKAKIVPQTKKGGNCLWEDLPRKKAAFVFEKPFLGKHIPHITTVSLLEALSFCITEVVKFPTALNSS